MFSKIFNKRFNVFWTVDFEDGSTIISNRPLSLKSNIQKDIHMEDLVVILIFSHFNKIYFRSWTLRIKFEWIASLATDGMVAGFLCQSLLEETINDLYITQNFQILCFQKCTTQKKKVFFILLIFKLY